MIGSSFYPSCHDLWFSYLVGSFNKYDDA
ncbi:MAG: hypothetical protein QOH41_1835, partial [Blastocatellia bacterium]|nr:hypothetical protein [Blastocatellia bacterium]